MSKTNILVVEDESIVAKDIQHSLKKLGYMVVDVVSSGEQAVVVAQEKKPDLVLMDIMLKGAISGIEAAQQIRESLNIPVIFLTAYADESTFNKAKFTEPYGYIIKPFKEVDLHTTIEMAIYKHEKVSEVKKERDFLYALVENKDATRDSIFIRANSRLTKIKNSDIVYIEALKDYVILVTTQARYTIHSTMKDILAKLPPSEFIRIHRSFIVRTERIAAIEYPNLILDFEKKILPIGGSHKDDLLNKINLL